ncbi:MAG: alpha-L-arabinofuranosidase, partial [Actinobacteria bacterium]|nr:alpha-L-arabinofuranosidase [Actinomycetota bacterium]
MNKGISRRVVLQGSVAAGLAAALPVRSAAAASADVSAVVDVAKTGDPISKNIYGAFSEHIGSLVYNSLWSEVLFDRKFFNAVAEQAQPAQKWIPLGPADAVTMDTTAPYVGEWSPVVALTRSGSRGIQQSGLSLAQKEYAGRIVVAGDAGARVTATLSWGSGQSQSVVVPVKPGWTTVPLRFASGGATTSGSLQIAGTGTGS